jgi:hypothetical protein
VSNVELSLGPITFRRLEVPSKINFGGRKRIATHRLASGDVVFDVLGNDEADIRFSGVFTGSDAVERAIQLDALRTLGITLPICWGIFSYQVLIKEFLAEYQSENWIPYSIACTVCSDNLFSLAQTAIDLISSPIADLSIAADNETALGVEVRPALNSITSATGISPGSWQSQATNASLSDIGSKLDDRMTELELAQPLANLTASQPTQKLLQSLRSATSLTRALWEVSTGRGLVGRARNSLQDAGY